MVVLAAARLRIYTPEEGVDPRPPATLAGYRPMSDDTSHLNRRNVLAGLGAVGLGGALVGAGTTALFSDEATLPNEMVAGELSLVVNWQKLYDSGDDLEAIDAFPDPQGDGKQDREFFAENVCTKLNEVDNPLDSKYRTENNRSRPLIDLDDIKPGDSGKLGLSYHLCDNDGWVWFRTHNKEYPPKKDYPHLVDEIQARLWVDMHEDTKKDIHPGDLEFQEGVEPIIIQGPLREVLDGLNDGIRLDGDPLRDPELECEKLETVPRKDIEKGAVLTFEGEGDDTIEIKITAVHRNLLGKVHAFSWKELTDHGICRVDVKNHASTFENSYDCKAKGTAVGKRGKLGARLQLDEVTFHYCLEEPDDPVCVPASTTQYLGLEWWLPDDVGNEVQTQGLSFDVQFYTEQCRHNPDPESPFEE